MYRLLLLILPILLFSCKTIEQTIDTDEQKERTDSFDMAFWRTIVTESSVAISDSSHIIFYRPDGSVFAEKSSWHNENASASTRDTTSQKVSVRTEYKTRTITRTVTKRETAIPFWKKVRIFLFGFVVGIALIIISTLIYIWKRK